MTCKLVVGVLTTKTEEDVILPFNSREEEELGKDDKAVCVTIKAIRNIILNIESQSISAY